jgi:PKHD-type hydroxylase
MIHHIHHALDATTVTRVRQAIEQGKWVDGKSTAGTQSAAAKKNLQLAQDDALNIALGEQVVKALSTNAQFFSASLPKRVYPPLFNRYAGSHNVFGDHIDNAIRTHPLSARHVRTDLSFTLFLSDPQEYEGGGLVIGQDGPTAGYKLPAGDLLLYDAGTIHRVEPVTRGVRYGCFSWVESMIREPQKRDLLYAMDIAIIRLREQCGDDQALVSMTGCYHNLLRMWADV